MTLKRGRSDMDSDHQRSNGLDLLAAATTVSVFTCKTCHREFSSFQALGGHRASHNKLPKLLPSSSSVATSSTTTSEGSPVPVSPPKPKSHECSICGLEFAIGQALGGHMRRHRQELADAAAREQKAERLLKTISILPSRGGRPDYGHIHRQDAAARELKPLDGHMHHPKLDAAEQELLDLSTDPVFAAAREQKAVDGHMHHPQLNLRVPVFAAPREEALDGQMHHPQLDAAELSTVPVFKKSISCSLELNLDLQLAPPGSYNTSRYNLKQLMTPLE